MANLTEDQKLLLKVLKDREALLEDYDAFIRRLRAKVRDGCTHPVTEPFWWEWDSGYGKQKTIKGQKCVLCQKRKHWESSTLWG